jgi:hypothetical protein
MKTPLYKRNLAPIVKELLSEFRIVYLTGPRQAGKTTLVRALAHELEMDYITLDDQAILESAVNDPHGLIRSLGSKRIVLDEFQYAPGLIPAIKEASDLLASTEKGKFLLTGSADIFRSARTQEALPGHMARVELYPLSLSELHNQPLNIIDYIVASDLHIGSAVATDMAQIADAILDGGYPEIQSKRLRSRRIWFNSYMEGRLYKDFESLHAARGDYHLKLQALLPYLAGLSGNLMKYSNIGNDLELNDKVVKNYVEILELMFILRRAPGYLKNPAKRQATRMPKLHFIDTGLACHLLGLRDQERLRASQYFGGLLESLVFTECLKQNAWAQEEVRLYHFRDNRQHEVDIVLEQDDGAITGIEVKASASVGVKDFKGLLSLADFAPARFRRGILFYGGDRILPFRQGDIDLTAVPLGVLTQGDKLT